MPKWIKEKIDDAEKDLNLEEKTEFEGKTEIQEDFLSKLIHKKVNSLDEYYAMAEGRSVSMARQVSNCHASLKQIELFHKSIRQQELPPLEPLIDTLKDYLNENKGEQEPMTKDRLTSLLGKSNSIYYGILRACVKKLLKDPVDSPSRCIILYGASSSGKSTISKYLGKIFDSFGFR